MQASIGSKPCLNVTVLSSTSLTCVADTPDPSDRGKQVPLQVFQAGRGYAVMSLQQGTFDGTFTVSDAWSNPGSWPNGSLPQAGDNVTIPIGQVMLLDVSPPPLGKVTIQGTLVFDYTQPTLDLRAKTVFVDLNGNLTISGPGSGPYPASARAQITLLGLPPDRNPSTAASYTTAVEQPMFDKALALRQGTVTLTGAPRTPAFSVLNATVDVGATSIVVNGVLLGWTVGG